MPAFQISMACLRNKLPRVALAIAGLLLFGLTIVRAVESWSNDSHLDHVAGIWVAQAIDLTDGTFYRAAYGTYGYGGTRYFPLFFCLHALAIKLFGGWRATGYALSAASVVLLLTAVYYLLRRIGASGWLAVGGCLAVLAGSSVQDALLTIREDAMAAMLSVWGVALCTGEGEDCSRHRPYYAAALFTLAFAVKETTIFGVAAAVFALLLNSQARSALRLLMLTSIGYALVVAGIYFGSAGRAFEVFRLTATVGVGLHSILFSPFTFVYAMRGDFGEMILLALGAACLLTSNVQNIRRIPSLLFLCTLAVTVVIFSSEGIDDNHLIDLHVAAAILLVDWALQMGLPQFGISACAVACFIVWLALVADVDRGSADTIPNRAQIEHVVHAVGDTEHPILAETPLLPIIAGQRPYLLDPFNFRVMVEKKPSLAEPMWQMLHEREFAAIVLLHDPHSDEGREFYGNTHFGGAFMERLERDYELAATPESQYLYLPRNSIGP
jgi:hypothetical protein